MPNIKSAAKRMRTSQEAQLRNRAAKTRIKNVRRDVLAISPEVPAATAAEQFKLYCSVLDKAAKSGAIKSNTAIRRKRRAAERLRKATAPAAAATA